MRVSAIATLCWCTWALQRLPRCVCAEMSLASENDTIKMHSPLDLKKGKKRTYEGQFFQKQVHKLLNLFKRIWKMKIWKNQI